MASSKRRPKNNAAPIRNELRLANSRGLSRKALSACPIARSVCPAHNLRKPLMCQPRARVEGKSSINQHDHRMDVLAKTGERIGGLSQHPRGVPRHLQGAVSKVDPLLPDRI